MLSDTVRRDRREAALGTAIWTVGAIKVAPQMPWSARLQAAVGTVAMLAVGVAWPSLHERSYLRWRTAAVASARLLLMGLPANFDSALFDAMTPALATGRFAGLINLSTILLGTHACLLLFLALLMPLPLRAHMRVQTATVVLLLLFGVHTHCRSQLFNTPEFGRVVAILHELMGLVSGTLTPLAVPPPPGSYAQSVSALLMTWAVVGWLLPTLLLLPFEASEGPEHNQAGASAGGWRRLAAACGRLEVIVEAWLRRLVPFTTRPPGQRHRGSAEEQAARGAGTHSALCWMVTLAALWQLCCSMAPLYGSGGDAPPH